ncbi:MAG: hypothetical protein HOM55_04950 [Proteobacteria bacterium]|jgi:hypothetical protein|nr:hypothetical protein [Pseudomonadota bacterium]
MWIRRLCVLLALTSAPAFAHHSTSVNFDQSTTIEVEGEITEIAWRNPHILFTLTSADGAKWQLATHSLSILRRMDAAESFINIGDHAKVAGWPARRGLGMFVNNMLLPSGEEFVFKFQAEPSDLRWSDRMWSSNDNWFAESGDASAEERGIFRVWSSTLAEGAFFLWLPEYPLTEEARAGKEAFDPAVDDPLLNCQLKGMPAIMSNPYPLEFHDRGDIIELQIEEYDSLRTIYINPETNSETIPELTPSIMGYSVGRWEGETLVVETTHVNWGHFSGRGVMLSDQARFVERFMPTETGGRLKYEITITDTTTFTEPVTMTKSWVWLPGNRVEPYECTI